jgi:hypothetical protein
MISESASQLTSYDRVSSLEDLTTNLCAFEMAVADSPTRRFCTLVLMTVAHRNALLKMLARI